MMRYHPATERLIERFKADLPQGILIEGPIGSGLGTLAEIIARHYAPERIVIGPDDKGTIGIDRIRELYTMARAKDHRVAFIIDDADRMGAEAQNALLKLLEEPLQGVRFILTSHDGGRLLPTIRSRVEAHAVAPITTEQSTALLTDLGVTDARLSTQLLFIADGLPALLSHYAADSAAFAERSGIVRDARGFLSGTREERLLVTVRYKDRSTALTLVRDMMALLRRSAAGAPKSGALDSLDRLLAVESAIGDNASVRLSLTEAALTV